MLDHLISHPAQTLGWVIVVYTFWLLLVRAWIEYRVRKVGGVRAPIVSSNLFTGLPVFFKLGRAQLRHTMPQTYLDFFKKNPDWSPHCAELSITGACRYLLTTEPEHIKCILTSKFADFGKGPQFHREWEAFLGDSIFTTDGQIWHDNRNLIRPMFNRERVRDLDIFRRWTDALVTKLPSSGVTVDVMDLFYRMTLDVTTDFLLGNSVNSLDNPQHSFARAFYEVQRMQVLFTVLAPFRNLMPHKSYREGIKVIEQFVMPYIQETLALPAGELEKRTASDKGFTFLHALARSTRDPKLIRDQLIAVLLAGRDTTAATLSWTIYELSRYPAVVAKLRREILAKVGREKPPSYDDLKDMPYLKHILNETLRLYPAVPFNIRTALQDTTLPGPPGCPDIAVLKDDSVTYSTLAMHRRTDLYPPASADFADPAVFSPDRWEVWTPRPWRYVPFNGGPRICVGQNFALTEMGFCLVRLFQKFERVEYRGKWEQQFLKTEIVGTPGQGVPVAFFESTADQLQRQT